MAFLRTNEFGNPNGPVVVLLSSIATTHEAWSEVIPALSGYRVITVDHRGHGGSGVPEEDPEGVGTLGRDVLAALDELGVDRFTVVGISLGGAIAQWLAANSNRVDKAVFAATATFLGGEKAWAEKTRVALHDGTSGLTPSLMNNWFTDTFRDAHPEVVERVAGQRLDLARQSTGTYRQFLRQRLGHQPRDRIGGRPCGKAHKDMHGSRWPFLRHYGGGQ